MVGVIQNNLFSFTYKVCDPTSMVGVIQNNLFSFTYNNMNTQIIIWIRKRIYAPCEVRSHEFVNIFYYYIYNFLQD